MLRLRLAGRLAVALACAILAFIGPVACDRDDLTSGPTRRRVSEPPPPPPPPERALRLNEVMLTNVATLADEDGDFPPWLEIYNLGDIAVNLAGLSLSNTLLDLAVWTFPAIPAAVIPPKGFVIVFLDGDTENPDDLHGSFTVTPGSVQLFLTNGTDIFDQVFFDGRVLAVPDTSAGRFPDGQQGTIGFLSSPTPGAPNAEPGEPPDPEPLEGEFIRADANGDGRLNISDMQQILGVLFAARPAPSCRDRLDANDDGRADVSDALFIGNFLFNRGPRIPEPFPDPGQDPTADSLECPRGG
jgi:hypothetical protein